MTFNRSYFLSLFVLLGLLYAPFLYVQNQLSAGPDLDRPFLYMVFLGLLVLFLILSRIVYKIAGLAQATRLNVYLGVFALTFFTYPVAVEIVQFVGGWWNIYYMIGWFLGAIAALVGVWICFRYLNFLPVAAVLTGAVLLLSGLQEIPDQPANQVLRQAPDRGAVETDKLLLNLSDYRVTDRRNIYYLLPDTFPRTDFLSKMQIIDNLPFEKELEASGFVISPFSTSNFHKTGYSLRSTFAMRVLNTPDLEPIAEQAGALLYDYQFNGWSTTHELLKRSGYTIFNAAGIQAEGFVECGDTCPALSYSQINRSWIRTMMALVQLTPLEGVLRQWFQTLGYGFLKSTWRQTFNMGDDDLDTMIRQKPFFLFLHAFTPHPPFLFDATCNYRSGIIKRLGKKSLLKNFKNELADEIRCARRYIKIQIARILAKDPTAVIILQSDHGLRIRNPDDVPEDLKYLNYFGNLSALRLPEHCRNSVPKNLSNANTFSLVLSCLGNRDIPAQYDVPDAP